MLIILLSALTAISAMLHLRAEYRGSQFHVYIFKPLTMLFIILIALQAGLPTSRFYKYMIVLGLASSLVGDVFLMLPHDRFVYGLASFLFAHLFYIAAFSQSGFRARSLGSLLPFLIYGSLMLWLLWPGLGKLRVPVIFYMAVILLMGWQAFNRWVEADVMGSDLALAGALLFIASDSILALNRFKRPFRSAQFLILSTYFAAQWLIALSIEARGLIHRLIGSLI